MAKSGQKWPILMKLILKNTSYEGSFITKIKNLFHAIKKVMNFPELFFNIKSMGNKFLRVPPL